MDNENYKTVVTASAYTYYDLMAVLCYYVHSLPIRYQNDLYKYVSSNFPQYVRKAIDRFPWLSMESLPLVAKYAHLDESLVPQIMELIDRGKLDDWAIILGTISNIDTMLSLDSNFKIFIEGRKCKILDQMHGGVSENYFKFEALNCNTKDQYGLVIPRLYCEWEKESSRTMETVALNPLSFALKNYLWVCNDNRWKITNLYCDFRNVGFNGGIIRDELPFKIVSSPINKQAPFYINLDEKNKVFYIEYLSQNYKILTARLKQVLDYAVSENADIVMFPEMMGSDVCIQFCKEEISNSFSEWRPKLFLLPSWEHEENGTWNNTLYVLDENGDCIFKYNKQHPFAFDKECSTVNGKIKATYFEPICADGNIFVIHVPGIGRIGVLICSDIFEDGYLRRLVKDLQITLLLYPVFTNGIDLMERALTPTIERSCDVILCNTCAAWDNTLEPIEKRSENNAFNSNFLNVYYPMGHKNYKNSAIRRMNFVDCKGTVCQGCLFVTKLGKKYDDKSCASEQIRLEGM